MLRLIGIIAWLSFVSSEKHSLGIASSIAQHAESMSKEMFKDVSHRHLQGDSSLCEAMYDAVGSLEYAPDCSCDEDTLTVLCSGENICFGETNDPEDQIKGDVLISFGFFLDEDDELQIDIIGCMDPEDQIVRCVGVNTNDRSCLVTIEGEDEACTQCTRCQNNIGVRMNCFGGNFNECQGDYLAGSPRFYEVTPLCPTEEEDNPGNGFGFGFGTPPRDWCNEVLDSDVYNIPPFDDLDCTCDDDDSSFQIICS